MRLHRLRLNPRSPWRTPWQADTLAGLLCATCARVHGPGALRARLLDPMLAGEPPFVLSDALPGDLLPLPAWVRLAAVGPGERKALKRARWLAPAEFDAARRGQTPPLGRAIPDEAVFTREQRRHNTLARDSDASLEEGGLYSRPDAQLQARIRVAGMPASNPLLGGVQSLTLYFRARDPAAADVLLDLLDALSLTGFGADWATGRGQFEVAGDPEPAEHLDAPVPSPDAGVVVLSTFQPAPGDPADGFWEVRPKFPKLGPDLGLEDVRKNTLLMLRPGACFRTGPESPARRRGFLGRALPMDLALPTTSAARLRSRGVEVVHPAFGLAVPAAVPVEFPS